MTVTIAGQNIIGGLVYVGSGLLSASQATVEPALIDPRLPVDMRRPDWAGAGLDYWPSYSSISPQCRAAYLAWLADGRRHPQVPIGYVFLYLYGLERRVLHDLVLDRSSAAQELSAIHGEVRRLLAAYGRNNSFRRYAGQLEQVLDVLAITWLGLQVGAPPAPTRDSPPSLYLRAGLGTFAARHRPVPVDWALSWIRSHPDYYPRTAATRCANEFDALFRRRYAAHHGDGLVARPGRKELSLDYRPASASFRGVAEITLPGIPDVLTLAAPTRKLVVLADECTSELEAYSRYLGRTPDGQGTVQAQALLPPELVDLASGSAGRAVAWARQRLGVDEVVLVAAEEFAALISSPGAKPTKKDTIALTTLLGQAGIGVEPDPRLGGPVPVSGSVVLFAASGGPTAAASDAYQAATLLLHLAAALSAADGETSEAEQRHLSDHLQRALHLTPEERRRLHAHLRWLTATQVKISGLTRRIEGIDENQRVAIAEFLTGVAAADGHISASEIKTLSRIYRLLALPPDLIKSMLPDTRVPPPASDPVTVRPAEPERGYAIPRTPFISVEPSSVRLDQAVIAAKLAETARVDALLGLIFADEEPAPAHAPPPVTDPVAGLDGRHSGLVRALAGVEQLSRAQFEELAARWSLLPDGALDQVNEAAYDLTGDPLLEGDDPIWVVRHVLGEMLT
ncbi:plasma membrane H+-transporting two-sector ATPase C subunit [Sphaerisporangium melleum]|uniref:Plasma membrane H+-transporting two-sector ATPase C subunit n=1 Tax=Sphaerisporangium melleum TaxID=321316 RepID=A0A917VIG1_9ACTN|nr:TerB N-terminal domain-containing protein [Sphaerisporangium melleum]GGK82218.1 plasma membrane H+-transporting two-sector ATPase C subunit [Sphaerisporangium melleum]GII71361.1 plasma membrane H+-transporting two-sector ATPase C subunit [Sphaerisporangium melleum]